MMASADDVPRLYTVREAADILGVDERTVYRRVERGQLGYVRVAHKRMRFTPRQLVAYIEAQTRDPQ